MKMYFYSKTTAADAFVRQSIRDGLHRQFKTSSLDSSSPTDTVIRNSM